MTPENWNNGATRNSLAKQWQDKHISAAVDKQITEELLDSVFCVVWPEAT
jgi:hypothetical protein